MNYYENRIWKLSKRAKLLVWPFWKWKDMKKDPPLTARLEKLAWHSYFINEIRRYSKRAKTWYPAGGHVFPNEQITKNHHWWSLVWGDCSGGGQNPIEQALFGEYCKVNSSQNLRSGHGFGPHFACTSSIHFQWFAHTPDPPRGLKRLQRLTLLFICRS